MPWQRKEVPEVGVACLFFSSIHKWMQFFSQSKRATHNKLNYFKIASLWRAIALYSLTYKYLFCPPPFAKAGGIKSQSSVRPSLRPSVPLSVTKNFNLAHIFWSINDRALIFGMHIPCDWPFQLTPCSDLDLDLWHISRSNLLPGGGPQFSEFACL